MNSRNGASQNGPTPDASRETDEEGRHAEPPVSLTPAEAKPIPPEAHRKVAHNPEKNWWDKTKPFLETAGVLLLAIYTGYTIKMYDANRMASNAAKLAAETSYAQLFLNKTNNATAISAQQQIAHDALVASQENLQKSIRASLQQFRLEQRAWVFVPSIQLDPPVAGRPILAKLNVANTGKTAATITTAKYTIYIVPKAEFRGFPDVSYQPVPMGALLTPGIPTRVECEGHELTQYEVDAIKAGSASLYIYGFFNYEDVTLGKHSTGYCGRYNPTSDNFFQPPECSGRNYAN
jgi:hypothetical protein